jgi:hypothetical protein
VVVTAKAELVGDAEGRLRGHLMAFDYEEAWLNLLIRLFGFGPWTYPGDLKVVEPLSE